MLSAIPPAINPKLPVGRLSSALNRRGQFQCGFQRYARLLANKMVNSDQSASPLSVNTSNRETQAALLLFFGPADNWPTFHRRRLSSSQEHNVPTERHCYQALFWKWSARASVIPEGTAPPRVGSHSKPSLPSRIAVIGNYLPRHCGIATFTTDLCSAIAAEFGTARLLALPVNDTEEGYDYPARVRWSLTQDDVKSYQEAAEFLNFNNIDMVCLQHEYGIFGGPAGSHILHSAARPEDARGDDTAYRSARTRSQPVDGHGGDR